MSITKCPVCIKNVVRESKDVSEVKEKGIVLGLLKASKEREDHKHESFRGLTSLLIHTRCHKNYTRTDTIKHMLGRHPHPRKRQDSLSSSHQFLNSILRTIVCSVGYVQRKKPKSLC